MPARACIQFLFPRRVLISPLWHIIRRGWARSQEGKVLVLKRECTRAMWLWKSGCARSPLKYGITCSGVSWPL